MNLKSLLFNFILLLLFIGCKENSTIIPHYNTKATNIEAILKLDTKGHTALIGDIIVTKSGDIISASDDKTIRVWDSATGKEKRKILGQIGAGSEGMIYAMALSPNNNFLAIGGLLTGETNSDKSSIRIYNYQTGKLLKVLKSHTNVVNDLAFSSDGKYLISGSQDNKAKIWSGKTFKLIDTIKFHTNHVYAVKIIKKANRYFAITAGLDNRIALYNMQTKKVIKSNKKPYKLKYLAVSKNHIAVCGSGKEIQIYDYSLNPIKTIRSETKPNGLAYSSNGKFLMAGVSNLPANVNIYSVTRDYQKIQSFKKHKNLVQAVAFLNNSTAVSGGGTNFEIYIWDIATGAVKRKIEGVGASVWSVGINRDSIAWGNHSNYQSQNNRGKLQKSINLKNFSIRGSVNQNFKRISTTNGVYSLIHRRGGMLNLPDGILDIKKSGKTIASIIRGSTNGYQHRCYGFYKNYIISGGANGALKIYNLKGQEIANLVGHTGEVWSIGLDGDRLVSGSSDQIIRIWDLSKLKRQMQPQLNLFISKTNEWIAWTPEGFYNASKGGEKYIGYHINQGSNKEARFLDISRFRKQFYRPDLIAKALNGEDISHYAQGIDIDSILRDSGGLPPKIEILTDSTTIHNNSIEIGVNICDMGGGFNNLNFYIDKKPVAYMSGTKAFRHRKSQVNNCFIIEQNLLIPSGKHTIGFNATNRVGNIISNTPTITITNLKKEQQKPNLHLLTLTISDYQDDALDLMFPNNDAKELSSRLKTIGKPIFKHVYTYALKDSQVTINQIDKKVEEIAKIVKPNDVFVLYISGHGITNESDGDYYFIPYDCPNGADVTKKAINQLTFKKITSRINTPKTVILLDTCQSGRMASQELINTSVNRFGGEVGSAIIAGASSKQNAIDGYKQHGIFTYTVLDAMSNKKVYSFDDKLSINEVAEYTKFLLPKIAKEKFNHEQNPTIYMNGDTTFAIGGI